MSSPMNAAAREIHVACIIFDLDLSHTLLHLRAKDPLRDHWASVGGKMHTGETMRDAAARELVEEIGVTDLNISHLCHPFIARHIPDSVGFQFWATADRSILNPGPNQDDGGIMRWVPLDEIPSILLLPDLADQIFLIRNAILNLNP